MKTTKHIGKGNNDAILLFAMQQLSTYKAKWCLKCLLSYHNCKTMSKYECKLEKNIFISRYTYVYVYDIRGISVYQ